ncbi:hypothetical protein B0H14DRAFT_3521809 [Mycena olivaceomarginata]|nr:hypothetical protein B0H14DRAFT_3521809 [Mycena olivaceomarginata]
MASNKKKPGSNKKKPGKPSDFQGEHAKFLEEFYPTYADASKRGKTHNIWKNFFISYWQKFPWRLPLMRDPDPNDATDYALRPQNKEELDRKVKLVPEMETGVLVAEPQDVRPRMREDAEAEHTALLVKHEDVLEAHTGYEISLLVGRVRRKSDNKLDIEAHACGGVTAATPAQLDFSRADERSYVEAMKTFSRFVWLAYKYRDSEEDASSRAVNEPTSTRTPTPEPAPGTAPAVPTNTFRDEDVRAFIQEGAPAVNLDDLNFPADLLPSWMRGSQLSWPSEPSPLIRSV